ncbi:MAG: mandelate racemase/muconate lactonizing enzyme family protein [Planctomycetes bacterium]|nr:mandelate racemase/muconate lactonizing enzyme family protein [Planctomycetota bacterium]
MKITAIETYIAGNPWKNWMFVRVLTDQGVHGVGEGTLNGFARTTEAAVNEMKHLVIGCDPFRIETIVLALTRDLYSDGGQIQRAACAAIEMACLDIKGKALGVPIYELLGGRVRDRIRAYANGWYRGDRVPAHFARDAKQVVADGFTALKFDPFGKAHLHMDKQDEDLSIAIIAAVREAVGPNVEMMIEGHCRFSVGQAVRIGRRLEPFAISWFEEPCPHHRISDTIEVARNVPVPVSSGESLSSKQQFSELIESRIIAVYQPEIMVLGGISQARQVAAMAEAANAVVAPHNAQGPLSTAACLHLAASCSNYLIQEYFDCYNVEWEKDLVTWHPTLAKDGTLDLPTAPGIGCDLNLDVIRAHPYQEGNYLPLYEDAWNKREGKKASTY